MHGDLHSEGEDVGEQGLADLVGQLRVSSAYETDPVGGPAQPDYLNAVAVGETTLAAAELLSLAKSL